MKDKNLQILKQLRAKLDKLNQPKASPQSKTNNPDQAKPKTRNQKNNRDKRCQRADEAWKKVAPKQGEPKTRQEKGRTWNWCMHHQAWCMHKEEDCYIKKGLNKQGKPQANQAQANQAKLEQKETTIDLAYAELLAHLATLEE